ncbi:endonuclease/exonuclease/phosphatase family protein-like protein [Clathrospora elynae]|uniref:Endonuclease/exonuclease/phosphatase family protein-like protein n=1 Tax=Clathrospora elynae TaxID=706981 RepID=A0A6A5SRB7_9PLEO|nr:endonuclease/exonuclease/phosphatase family protein-like protein [Clathrospora elynae]
MANLVRFFALTASVAVSSATTIAEINGPKFLSPFKEQTVSNVPGIITAKGPDGLWIRSTRPDRDERTSESLYVFGHTFGANLTVGDSIVVGGKVLEYRSNKDYIYLTELSAPVLESIVSSGNNVKALIIGKDTRDPPKEQYSSLDGGDVFAVPNNVSQISTANPALQPQKYGLDFWESLSGELVTVKNPTALTKPSQYGDTWVVGNWKVSGRNDRDGLTMTDKDANPEAIIIGTPLDGSKNPTNTRMGDSVEEITGIVSYAFGFYRILPTTAIKVTKSQKPAVPKTTNIKSKGKCDGITFGAYNVENLAATSAHHPALANHIVNFLNSPDVMFIQEVQDDNGVANDAVVSANLTLTALTAAIAAAGGPNYTFTDIVPVDDQDGGAPGGNIRVAYLYKPSLIRLYKPNPGGPLDANEVLKGPTLKYNPGRIDPANEAWTASRKPLVAQWEVIGKKGAEKSDTFFTVNVHFGSKGGSSSLHGDARPPVNGGVEDRLEQARLTANFVKNILSEDRNARVITAGDFNEFTFVEPLSQYAKISGLKDLDAVVRIDKLERYTYLFDMNAQQLDHMFVSETLAKRSKAEYEHVHVNTWTEYAAQVSDHDPSVARLDVCA